MYGGMEYITDNEIKTQKVAQELAKTLNPGNVVALFGDLGSGKTAFAKGIAVGLNIKDQITSPTFVFVKEYPIQKCQSASWRTNFHTSLKLRGTTKSQNIKLVHVDCYRMNDERDAESIGLTEYFGSNNIVVIEWADRVEKLLTKGTTRIYFENLGQNKRKIKINRGK